MNWSPSQSIYTEWEGVTVNGNRITRIELSDKSLEGRIPAEIGDLTGLTTLDLSDNDLTGSIPRKLGTLTGPNEPLGATNTAKLSGLTTLLLHDNDLSGSIPTQLWNLTTLTELRLDGNRLTGSLHSDVENLDALETLNLSDNGLSDNGLSSNLPAVPSEPAMSGDPLKLQSLTTLDLGGNSFSGSIPDRFGSLSRLTELRLDDNSLNGSILTELGSLSSLRVLDLTGNSLNQAVPVELDNLSSLMELYLAKNQLSGEIPFGVDFWTSLERLDLSENRLTGTIPIDMASRLFNLQYLSLAENRLDGEIPEELENLAGTSQFDLQDLYLAHNLFTGCIPAGLRDVAFNDLSEIDLVHCDVKLSGLTLVGAALSPAFAEDTTGYTAMVGPSPVTVTPTGKAGANVTFRYLDSSDAEHPDADGNDTNGHQVDLESGRTTIKVEVNSGDGKATHTYTITVNRPSAPGRPTVTDPITAGQASLEVAWTAPTSTGGTDIPIISYDLRYIESAAPSKSDANWTVVEEAWKIGDGDLTETLEPLIGGAQYDVQVRAYNRARHSSWSSTVRGTPTAITCNTGNTDLDSDCQALLSAKDVLQGSRSLNWLAGNAPSSWEGVTVDSTSNRVTALNLANKSLDGSIPSSLGQLTELTTLDLSSNGLTGPIPSQLGNLSNLTVLNLSENELTGAILSELGNLTNLTKLRLDFNDLSGNIPSRFSRLTALEVLELTRNELEGSIPSGLGSLTSLKELKLAENSLTGSIPSSLGSLSNLEVLHLERNGLSGSIPTQLGNATALTELDLGYNQISGRIPSQLNNLVNLTILRLNSQGGLNPSNRLSGEIPTLSALTKLTELNLYFNLLTGPVPSWLGDLTTLTVLDLGFNRLTG